MITTPPNLLPAPLSTSRERWILAATIIASTMAFSDMTIVNVALPVLQRDLGASFAAVQWVVEAYTLVLSAMILVGGATGDLYGRRRVFAIGIVVFALASAACGLAPDAETLVAARGLQGFGAALMMPGSLAILSASFPRARHGDAIGLWSASTGVAMAIAPAFGGWLIDTFSWHAAFLINLPLAVLALAITLWRVPESRAPESGTSQAKRLDLIGMALATLGLGALTFGLIAAGERGFSDPASAGPLLAGIALLALFIAAERRAEKRRRHPMIPPRLFRLPDFGGIQAFTFLLWAALQGTAFFVPFRLMQVQGFAPTEAGMALLPLVVISALLSRWFGRLADRVSPRRLLVAGALLTGTGFILLAVPDEHTQYLWGFMPALVMMGIGMGVCQVPVTVVALNAAGPGAVGTASAINNMAARTGGLIAVALFGLVLAHGYSVALTPALKGAGLPEAAQAAIAAQRAKLAGALLPPGLDPAQQEAATAAIKHAFISGYRWAMACAGAMAYLSALVALRFIRNRTVAEMGGAEPGPAAETAITEPAF
jgi:EmrB/QacA subfamily drug resistance transporter